MKRRERITWQEEEAGLVVMEFSTDGTDETDGGPGNRGGEREPVPAGQLG